MALKFNLAVAEKPDSQEKIFRFVPGNDYAAFIKKRVAPAVYSNGLVVYKDGTVVGQHDGLFNFTIGQRKGLGSVLDRARAMGLDPNDDLCVIRIDAAKNAVILGPEADIKLWGLWAANANWLGSPNLQKTNLQARIRHRSDLVDCHVELMPDNCVRVKFFEPQRAITPAKPWCFMKVPCV